MELDPGKIGKQFRQKRGARSQEDIEDATGVSQTSIDRIEKGNWKKLSEAVVILARYYSVDLPEVEFDEHIESSEVANGAGSGRQLNFPGIPELETRAGMGGGGIVSIEIQAGNIAVDPIKPDRWFLPPGFVRDELQATPGGLLVVEAKGDSMIPTLTSGERVFVDTNHKKPSPDGLYALRDQFGSLVIKRLHALAKKGQFSIISDNPSHPPKDIQLRDLQDEIVGRVVGAVRRL